MLYIKRKVYFSSLRQYKQRCGQIFLPANINLNPIFSLLFFEPGFLITHHLPNFQFFNLIGNNHLEGTVSQIFYLGPSFYFL